MKTRRLKLTSEILAHVKTFLEGAEFKNRSARVKEYVHWALRKGGPAYFESPVPASCMLEMDDANYPVGFFSPSEIHAHNIF